MSIATTCRICCLDDDIRRAIDTDLSAGLKPSVVARKYAAQINRSRADSAVSRHKNLGHIGKEPADKQMPNPGTVAAIKEEQHRRTVEERIDLVFEEALEMARLAKAKEDYRTAATCLREATASTALMGKSSGSEKEETESDGYIEAVRATAKNDWKEARAVQMEATKQKAEASAELVDA